MPLTPDQIAEMDQALSPKVDVSAMDAVVNAPTHKLNNIDSAVLGAAQGMAFNLADEGAAGLMTLANKLGMKNTSPSYDENLTATRQTLGDAQQQNPDYYLGGTVAGGIVPAAAIAGGGLAERAAQLLKAKPILGAAGTGGIQGALYGFGEGQGNGYDRLGQALSSGAGGAAVGGALGASLSGISNQVAKSAARKVTSMEPDANLAPNDTVASKIIDRLAKQYPDPNDFKAALDSYASSNASLAETGGPRIQNLAKGAVQYPQGRAVGEEFFYGKPDAMGGPSIGGQVTSSSERVTNSLENNISGNKDYYGSLDEILTKGREKAAPAYKKSESQIVQSDTVNMPEVQSAIAQARTQFPSELKDFPDNSVKVLDYAKRVLDDQIGAAQRQGQNNFARARLGIKNQLTNDLDAQSPDYAKARGIAGDYLSNSSAMDAGKNFRKTSSKLLQRDFSKLNDTEKESFRAGVVQSMRDLVDTGKDNSNLYGRTFGNAEIRNKLKVIMPEDAFKRLDQDMWAENRLFDLKQNTIGGSPTAPNMKAAEEFANQHADMFAEALKGRPITSAVNIATREIGKMFDGLSDRTAGQVAEALFETDPQKKLALVRRIQNKTGTGPTPERQALQAYFNISDALKSKLSTRAAGGVAATGINAAQTPLKVNVYPQGDPRNGAQ